MLKQWSIFLLEYGIFQEIFRKLFQAIFLLTEIYPLIVPRRFFFRGIYILNYAITFYFLQHILILGLLSFALMSGGFYN